MKKRQQACETFYFLIKCINIRWCESVTSKHPFMTVTNTKMKGNREFCCCPSQTKKLNFFNSQEIKRQSSGGVQKMWRNSCIGNTGLPEEVRSVFCCMFVLVVWLWTLLSVMMFNSMFSTDHGANPACFVFPPHAAFGHWTEQCADDETFWAEDGDDKRLRPCLIPASSWSCARVFHHLLLLSPPPPTPRPHPITPSSWGDSVWLTGG